MSFETIEIKMAAVSAKRSIMEFSSQEKKKCLHIQTNVKEIAYIAYFGVSAQFT